MEFGGYPAGGNRAGSGLKGGHVDGQGGFARVYGIVEWGRLRGAVDDMKGVNSGGGAGGVTTTAAVKIELMDWKAERRGEGDLPFRAIEN